MKKDQTMQRILEMMTEMNAKVDANQAKMDGKHEKMLARMQADMKSGQAEMRSTIRTFGSDLKETTQRVMRAAIKSVRSELDETTAWRDATETKSDPGKMQATEEHQEISKGEDVVMPVGEPRKRSRVRNLAEVCSHKVKERTRGNSASRWKSVVSCRKVSRRAKVVWRKRNPFIGL
jgi:hypothetical protein